jgi:hypothetical protein
MRPTSTPLSHRLPAAKVCSVSTLARLDSIALFDGSLAPYIPDRTCLCEGPRVAFCRLFARCDYV